MNRARITLVVLFVFAVGAAPIAAHAACDFNGAPKAKGMKTSFVRAFQECPDQPYPNLWPQCTPTLVTPGYRFDESKGGCSFQASAKVEEPCSVPSSSLSCLNTRIKAKCSGILWSDGSPIDAANDGWALALVLRMTVDEGLSSTYADTIPVSVLQFPGPLEVSFDTPSKGSIQLQTDTNTILSGLDYLGLGLNGVPECSQIEIVSVAILDPGADAFAVPGFGSRP